MSKTFDHVCIFGGLGKFDINFALHPYYTIKNTGIYCLNIRKLIKFSRARNSCTNPQEGSVYSFKDVFYSVYFVLHANLEWWVRCVFWPFMSRSRDYLINIRSRPFIFKRLISHKALNLSMKYEKYRQWEFLKQAYIRDWIEIWRQCFWYR